MIGAFIQVNLDSQRARCNPIGYVIHESGCWEWVGTKSSDGYGSLKVDGRMVGAHRHFYEKFRGPIPEGKELDHVKARCALLRPCVNPDHLEPVSHRENVLRGESFSAERSRRAHCRRGHPLTGTNLQMSPGRDGRRPYRRCLACRRSHDAARPRKTARRVRRRNSPIAVTP